MAQMKNRSSIGRLMLLIGLLMAVPLVMLPFYPGEAVYARSFLTPALFSMLLGLLVCALGPREAVRSVDRQEALQRSSLTVLFTWLWGILVGAVPFVLSGQLTAIQALFESVSGWTTTGLSVMDVSASSHIFLFYRSFMQYCGGLGFVMMMVVLVSGKNSMDLFSAEGHPDKLMPNLKQTARAIFAMYALFLAAGTIAYTAAGMPLFESLCHTMCSLSTGGFSTRLDSIGAYHSLPIELVTIVLMLIGTTNFAVLMLLLKRKWRQAFRVSEVRFLFLLLLLFVPLTAVSLVRGLGMGAGEGLRRAVFDLVSALSTTGYSSMSYQGWPPFAFGVLILMMLIGGGMGSTAGGMKLTRVYLMLRMVGMDLRRRVLPHRCVGAPHYWKAQGKARIDGALCADTVGFVACYLLLYAAGSLLLTVAAGCSLSEGLFEFASALGTVGLSIGLTGPTTGAAALAVEMFGMVLGRLEIFLVLTGIYSGVRALRQRMGGAALRRIA